MKEYRRTANTYPPLSSLVSTMTWGSRRAPSCFNLLAPERHEILLGVPESATFFTLSLAVLFLRPVVYFAFF